MLARKSASVQSASKRAYSARLLLDGCDSLIEVHRFAGSFGGSPQGANGFAVAADARGTQGILNAAAFSQLPRGASVVNAARGGHLVGADLLAGLDSGHLAAAILDVTDPEPPPLESPLWKHPRVWLTPHIASSTTAQSGAEAILDNLDRHARGLPLIGLVDRARGY